MNLFKLIPFLCIQFISLAGFSQITLDYSNFMSVGDSIVEYYDATPNESIIPGEAGPNKTWDFQGLKTYSSDTITIVTPDKTIFHREFYESDVALAMSSTDSLFSFYNNSNNQLKLTGVGYFANKKRIIKKEDRIILKYPLKYLDENQQVFKEEKILYKDSLKVITTSEHNYKVDAWGDLKLSSGIFFSLRVKRSIKITESHYKFIDFTWQKFKKNVYPNISYEWWTDDPKAKHYIAYLSMDSENKKAMGATFIPAIPFQEKIDKIQSTKLILYPNPTQKNINVHVVNDKNYINIYTITGQLIYSQINSSGNAIINVSRFSSGMYVLVIKSASGEILGKGKFIKN